MSVAPMTSSRDNTPVARDNANVTAGTTISFANNTHRENTRRDRDETTRGARAGARAGAMAASSGGRAVRSDILVSGRMVW